MLMTIFEVVLVLMLLSAPMGIRLKRVPVVERRAAA
jgi:hypothetical protein